MNAILGSSLNVTHSATGRFCVQRTNESITDMFDFHSPHPSQLPRNSSPT